MLRFLVRFSVARLLVPALVTTSLLRHELRATETTIKPSPLTGTHSDSTAQSLVTFVNPIYEGADPWLIRHNNQYLLCGSEGDQGVSVWASDRLTEPGVKRVVWKSPSKGWNSRQIWAPELHYLNGKWYIYYAASDGQNENHRAGVLEAQTDDPQGPYTDRGMLYTGDDVEGQTHNCWAIDATPIEINDRLYLVWSGWPDGHDVQYLYIARMENPWTVATKRVRLCTNDTHLWERVGEIEAGRGLHEGPQALIRNGRVFIVYSCSASWEPTYKLGMIWMDEQADPLDPQSWRKHDRPVFQGTDEVLGVGHASFTRSPDDSEDWIVYHTKVSTRPGWERAVHIQRFTWTADGLPDFGSPVSAGRIVEAPRGEPGNQPGISFFDAFDQQTRDKWAYYGFNRYIWVQDGRLSLGGRPTWGLVNNYRSGEKALVRGFDWSDLTASVKLQVVGGNRQAGLCFRIQQPAVGYNAYRGYFAAIVPGERKIVLGKADGSRWHELASAEHPMANDQWYTLKVEAVGDRLQVFLNNEKKIEVQDADYARGMAGVRVVDTHALFDEFVVQAHPNVIPGPVHLTEAPVQPPTAESTAQAHPTGSPAQVTFPAVGVTQAQATVTTAPASPDQPQVHIENAILKGAPPAPTRISDSPNK